MNQLEYLPGIGGQAIQLDGPVAFVGTADKLRGREWNYDLGYRDLLNANRPARVVDVTLWTDADTANALRRVADADVMAGKPGTFVAQNEWRQRGYILEAEPRAIHYGDLEIGLKVALLDGAWWRMVEKEFLPEETPVTEYASETGEIVTVTGAVETPLHSLKVYGKSVQNGTPTPDSPVSIDVIEPASGDSIYIDVDGAQTAIDLQGYVLASLPDGTHDELTIDSSGNVVLHKNVGEWTFDSNSVISATTSKAVIFNISAQTGMPEPARLVKGVSGYCDHYTVNANFSSTSDNGTVVINSSDFSSIKRVAFYDTANLSNYSTWLASNPVKIMYPLATPTTTDLGYITMPNVEDGSYVKVVAAVTPTITAEWVLTSEFFLDYPHNYEYDYSEIAAADSIESSVYTPSDVHLVIFGPATNPYILVGGNKYQVNVTVPSGGYVTIDGREKTIVLTLADGTDQNAFSYGVRGGGQGGGTYVFEPIQAGTQEVTYSGAFGFNLGWYEEEGEPPWKSY